jgi:glycosyltransferase involved in cell wall biosynthesis
MFSRVDGIETVGKDGAGFSRKYGVNDERIFQLPNAFDVNHFVTGRSEALPERRRIRKQLRLCGVTFIYVGRLRWGKGVDILLEAFRKLQRLCHEKTTLLFVGDGSEEGHLRQRCLKEGIHSVVFAGFQQKQELPSYYAAADVFVFPTLGDTYGLVVDEAMICSLPVISTNAVGEIHDRIEDGLNGYIIQPENSEALCERMERLARDPELREKMSQYSAGRIKEHTPQRWAENFESAVDKIFSMSRR